MRSILSLPPALQAVWTAVYAAVESLEHTGYDTAMERAWEAVRRANGGVMPEEQEREEEKRLAILNEAVKQPCPVTGQPFFMVIKHPDLGWVPTYGGPYDSWTAPDRNGSDPDESRASMLFRWHYDHDNGAWGEYEAMGMRAVVETRTAEEPTGKEMVEALAPIVADAIGGSARDEACVEKATLLLRKPNVIRKELDRVVVNAALDAWNAARAWGRK